METIKLELTASQVKILLEALAETDKHWAEICDTSDDEDTVADYGNDLVLLRIVRDEITPKAIAAFGSDIVNFDRG
ncbi:hypothetical protein KDX32_29485 [Burkholderia ambifaria]|jgi:hypothetical protein|uniref:Uncharacterized protein n=2 Tax=Burkholderia ambifaria TaxID=152480 RepID=A0AA41EE65_9BURK|nr:MULTISPECIES: hypothetical protein [Burkholderia]ACB65556.1 conserved hypothetical protein [Burkholderia ambifaria MC40-6]MBR8067199.1 hypothetical protein [Burkholderia ambifaria]MBR8133288.1 hypothetical protein [Burkholderia ambifaria]MBR8179445.1 hypothetical protein [Burkholderia ambifaria]MBR8256649.1 hypothetical protein [Burkholderia ambifaria]